MQLDLRIFEKSFFLPLWRRYDDQFLLIFLQLHLVIVVWHVLVLNQVLIHLLVVELCSLLLLIEAFLISLRT